MVISCKLELLTDNHLMQMKRHLLLYLFRLETWAAFRWFTYDDVCVLFETKLNVSTTDTFNT